MSDGEKAPVAKVKAKAPAKKKVAAEHPTFKSMVVTAITELKDRKGSSRQAILKYVKEHNKVGDNAKIFVNSALVKGVKDGELIQQKGTGASGSFKLPKVEKKLKTKKAAAKKTPKKAAPKKKAVVKKVAVKKSPAKKKPAAKKKKTPKKVVKKPAAAKKPAAKKTPKKKAAKKTAKK